MESRAEYNSEEDDDDNYNGRDKRIPGGSRTHNPGQRSIMSTGKKFGDRDMNNITGNSHLTDDALKKKKTLSSKFFGGINKYLKN